MTLLAAVVVLLAVVTAAHLLLTFALIRRVRLLQEQGVGGHAAEGVPRVGSRVGSFETETTTGRRLTEADVADALVVFLSPGCAPCLTLADDLLRKPPSEAITVFVAGEPGPDTDAMADRVARLGTVAVVGDGGGPVTAFGAEAFPSVVRTRGGVVEAAGLRMKDVGSATAAPART
ncbi:MAG TPA: hypothetical protein VGX28_10090 [Frankiaceae bacterium]|jgi:hypothetical protein|nr:hypothetical protein [Frankiaceae bacterium]